MTKHIVYAANSVLTMAKQDLGRPWVGFACVAGQWHRVAVDGRKASLGKRIQRPAIYIFPTDVKITA